jgi:peptidoglycan/LPS O-acetylase OafA/YrhL
VFFSSLGATYGEKWFLQPIHTGALAVDFFFALSGFVLSARKPTCEWMVARLIRLYPLYLFGLIFGGFVSLLISKSLPTDFKGVFLSLFGLQSLTSNYQLVLNPPLWSLSVELILTPFFLAIYLVKSHKWNLFILFIAFILLSLKIDQSVVLRAIPFFILGSILFYIPRPVASPKFKVVLLGMIFFYLGIGARILFSLNNSGLSLLVRLGTIFTLMYCLLGVQLKDTYSEISTAFGNRAYALYVVHGPLLGVLQVVWRPDSPLRFLGYFCSAVVLVFLATEVTYLVLDRWALDRAAAYLRK